MISIITFEIIIYLNFIPLLFYRNGWRLYLPKQLSIMSLIAEGIGIKPFQLLWSCLMFQTSTSSTLTAIPKSPAKRENNPHHCRPYSIVDILQLTTMYVPSTFVNPISTSIMILEQYYIILYPIMVT